MSRQKTISEEDLKVIRECITEDFEADLDAVFGERASEFKGNTRKLLRTLWREGIKRGRDLESYNSERAPSGREISAVIDKLQDPNVHFGVLSLDPLRMHDRYVQDFLEQADKTGIRNPFLVAPFQSSPWKSETVTVTQAASDTQAFRQEIFGSFAPFEPLLDQIKTTVNAVGQIPIQSTPAKTALADLKVSDLFGKREIVQLTAQSPQKALKNLGVWPPRSGKPSK